MLLVAPLYKFMPPVLYKLPKPQQVGSTLKTVFLQIKTVNATWARVHVLLTLSTILLKEGYLNMIQQCAF